MSKFEVADVVLHYEQRKAAKFITLTVEIVTDSGKIKFHGTVKSNIDTTLWSKDQLAVIHIPKAIGQRLADTNLLEVLKLPISIHDCPESFRYNLPADSEEEKFSLTIAESRECLKSLEIRDLLRRIAKALTRLYIYGGDVDE